MDKYEELLSRADRFRDMPMVGELMNAVRELKEREEVIHCRECVFYNEDCMSPHSGWCECLERGEYNDHFCNYGERKDNDQ